MSRPQKMHKPIKGVFNNILAAIAAGTKPATPSSAKAVKKTAKLTKPRPK